MTPENQRRDGSALFQGSRERSDFEWSGTASIAMRAARPWLGREESNLRREPSREDVELTRRLRDAGDLPGIPLHDHVVVARDGRRSATKEL